MIRRKAFLIFSHKNHISRAYYGPGAVRGGDKMLRENEASVLALFKILLVQSSKKPPGWPPKTSGLSLSRETLPYYKAGPATELQP